MPVGEAAYTPEVRGEVLQMGVDELLCELGDWIRSDPEGFYLPEAVRDVVDALDRWDPLPGCPWDATRGELAAAGVVL